MFEQKEYIREGHMTYITYTMEEMAEDSFELEMCRYNRIQGIIPFQIHSENGRKYMRYNITSLQSMDVYYKKKKLDMDQVILLLENLLDAHRNCKVYLLDINKLLYNPEYIMYDSYKKQYQFFYQQVAEARGGMEDLVVFLVENIRYDDITLVKIMHEFYENIIDSGIYVDATRTVSSILEKLYGRKSSLVEHEKKEEHHKLTSEMEESEPIHIYQEATLEESEVHKKHKKEIELGICIGFTVNCLVFLLWRPYTLLKVFAFSAFFIMFLALFIQQKISKHKMKEIEREEIYLKEYNSFVGYEDDIQNETRVLLLNQMEGTLYKKSKELAEDIYFQEGEHVIGSTREQAHIVVALEGISRVHAEISIIEGCYYIEDLNSKNGTWVNENQLLPKEKKELRHGDIVRFAKYEYEFR